MSAAVAFRAATPSDIVMLRVQPSQAIGFDGVAMEAGEACDLVMNGDAWTAHEGDRLLCCAGFRLVYPSHAIAWALLAEGVGAAHVAITRFARARIADSPIRRIEALVRAKVPAERRWAELVGLEFNALLRAWGEHGEDHLLFERIRS